MWEHFNVVAMTAAINTQGYVPGQIRDSGLFEEEGVSVTTIEIEEEKGQLSLIEPTARGGPGVTIGDSNRVKIPFTMDHFEINDFLSADEVQGVRQLGSDNELETLEHRINMKLARHARSMDNTLEHQRVGAIKGLITSKSGTVLHNLYDRFGIAVPAPLALGINAEVAGLGGLIKNDVVLSIEDDLDEAYSGVHAMCGRDFHAKLWGQKVVRETFLNTNGAGVLRQGIPDVFEFADITWERYRTGKKAKSAANGAAYIADDEARVYPLGVPDMFITRFGPADYEETVNTVGLPRYARQYASQNGKGRHLDCQMNTINLCTRPGALRKLTIA